MNVNSPQPMLVIKDWLFKANKKLLNVGISSSMLDAELLLSFALGVERTYLHANHNDHIDSKLLDKANIMLSKRLKRIPIAYIIGSKDFYGRKFIVNPSTLIPRPESEDMIEMLKKYLPLTINNQPSSKLVDVGTGSGCLGITAKLELPELDVSLIDIDPYTLSTAKKNADSLSAKVNILEHDLLKNFNDNADIIIANLPYVDKSWEHSPEIEYEPSLALYATDKGLYLIKKLINQASDIQVTGNLILLESDPCQHTDLINYATEQQYSYIDSLGYILLFKKT